MRARPVACAVEEHVGLGAGGCLCQGLLADHAEGLRASYGGQVQCLYMDPPYFTGQRFSMRMRVGQAGWSGGRSAHSLTLPAYSDQWENEAQYLAMMKDAVQLAHDLLSDSGLFFLHIDYRMHGHLRQLADLIFGGGRLMNEIIWAYQSGGRSKRHFSRKHDVILLYQKGRKPFFDITAVAVPRGEHRSNHMRRHVDAQGRAYSAIRSGGKEYRYYDDDPVYLSDVWTDISHLQQKDPERTGYDTQKPLKLLERIVLCASRPGDLVADLFFGSGTTLVAAAGLGRRFLGLDAGVPAHSVARKRLLPYEVRQALPENKDAIKVQAQLSAMIGFYQVELLGYTAPEGKGLDLVDQWSVGLLRGETFHSFGHGARTVATPQLPTLLEMPVFLGQPALLVADVYGRRRVFALEA